MNFVLEVGASCVVKFSNFIESQTPTLNINSTGAKNMISGRNSTSWGRYTFETGAYDGNYEYDHTIALLCTYNGSSYTTVGCALGKTGYYSYND